MSDNLIHSASRTQGSVALSSAEAEFYALCSAVMEALFLRNLMAETGLGSDKIMARMLTDSMSAKSIVSRQGPGKRCKHIDLKFLFLQAFILDGQVIIQKSRRPRIRPTSWPSTSLGMSPDGVHMLWAFTLTRRLTRFKRHRRSIRSSKGLYA